MTLGNEAITFSDVNGGFADPSSCLLTETHRSAFSTREDKPAEIYGQARSFSCSIFVVTQRFQGLNSKI